MSQIRVAIVDDHAIVRRGLADLIATTDDLEFVGEASDGSGALDLVARTTPDVVLMDLRMADVDGASATRQITTQYPNVHVVVLTSFADQTSVVAAFDAGAVGYVLKHAEPDAILNAVRVAVEGGSQLDPAVARALLRARSAPRTPEGAVLTERESEVLEAVRRGLANKQIARELGISERTVKAHLTNVFQRLGVTDRTQAALWAQNRRHET